MRKLIFNLAVSLDGYIEGPQGEFDWCFTDQDYGMNDFLASTDAILFGRKSYHVLLNYETNPYPDKNKYVFSRSLQVDTPNTFVFTGNLEAEIKKLKTQPGKNIWLFGGADLSTQCLHAGLIDEMVLSVHPVLLGSGKPLFTPGNDRTYLNLQHSIQYSSGLVQLYYEVKNPLKK